MQGTFSSLTLGKRRWRCVMLCSPHKNFQIRNIFFLKVINVFLVVCWNDKNGTCKEQVPTKRKTERLNKKLFQRGRVLLQTKTLIKTLSFFTSRPLSLYILNNDAAIFQATITNHHLSPGNHRQLSEKKGGRQQTLNFFYNFKSHWHPHLYTIYEIIFSVTRRSKSDSVSESLSH